MNRDGISNGSLRRIFQSLVALSVMTGGATLSAQVPTAKTGASHMQRANPAPAKKKPKPPPKNPRQMAEQLIPILKTKKMPWQIYVNYSRIYYDFAIKEQRKVVTSKRAASYKARFVQHLQQMGNLLQQMGDAVKIRHAIQKGTSDIPPEDRQPTFSRAGRTHDVLLEKFVRMAAMLPKNKTISRTSSAVAPSRPTP